MTHRTSVEAMDSRVPELHPDQQFRAPQNKKAAACPSLDLALGNTLDRRKGSGDRLPNQPKPSTRRQPAKANSNSKARSASGAAYFPVYSNACLIAASKLYASAMSTRKLPSLRILRHCSLSHSCSMTGERETD